MEVVVKRLPFLYQDQGDVPPDTEALTPPELSELLGAVKVMATPTVTAFVTTTLGHPDVGLEMVAEIVAFPLKVAFLVNVLEVAAPEGKVAAFEGVTDQFTVVPVGTETLKEPDVHIEEAPIMLFELHTKAQSKISDPTTASISLASHLPFLALNEICGSLMPKVLNEVVKFVKGIALLPVGGVAAEYLAK